MPRPRAARDCMEALVSLLDDDSPVVWERVRVRLEAEGRAAEPALRRAARSHVPRIRARARVILLGRERKLAARRLVRHAASPDVELESGLWLVARFVAPGLDMLPYRRALDTLGREFAKRIENVDDPIERCLALRDFLGRDLDFGGSIGEYAHSDNLCIHRAIERRGGLPLTLSAVYAFVARRAGLRAALLPLPHHVLLRLYAGPRSIVLDPYQHGQLRGQRDVMRILASHGLSLRSPWFREGNDAALFARQLRNLIASAAERSLWSQARLVRPALELVERRLAEERAAR